MAYIYMVRCTDRSLYTGIAKNLGQRMREHYYRKKSGAKYTKSRQVISLEMVWETESWSDAAKLEVRIMKPSKAKKELLICRPEQVKDLFNEPFADISYEPHPEFELNMFLEDEEGQT